MQLAPSQHASGSKSTKLAVVVAIHVLLGIALIKTMHVRTLSLPSMPSAVELIHTIDPPPVLPPPTALAVATLPAPAIVVPAVEVPLPTPPVQSQVTTTTASDPLPLQPPAATAATTTPPAVQGNDAGVSVRAASMLDGCAKPAYPAQSARNGASGTVTLALLVGMDGHVNASRIARSSGFKELDQAALGAMSQCRFRPAMHGDVAQAGWALVAYDWKLE
jgi:protein TonB